MREATIYHQGRLTHIHYPVNHEMDVYYEYGDPAAGNQAGRITRMQDASGVQEFSYGKLGEVIENVRTFVLPGASETYTYKWSGNTTAGTIISIECEY